MAITQAGREKVRARVGASGWERPDPDVLADLNAPAFPNPAPCPMVPRTLTTEGVLALLTQGAIAALWASPNLGEVLADIRANRHAEVTRWAFVILAAGVISPEQYAAVCDYVETDVPDPTWKPLLGWAELPENLGRPATLEDVAASREYDPEA